jgi:serine/threonine protein kinase
VQQLAAFKHPHLVEIYKFWTVKDYFIYIEMESSEGPLDVTKLTFSKIFDTFSQLLSGINFLHQNFVTHGDVHPCRIHRFPNDVVKFNTLGLPSQFKRSLILSE